jgi:lipopolysaccharide/colanic/teichoic acid biosynthesis glycosyltransferase
MSLVGPRPPIPYEVELYSGRELERLRVTPGLTGLWQISGRGSVSFQQMIELDLVYINQWSLGLDLRILFQTPWVVVNGRGAA